MSPKLLDSARAVLEAAGEGNVRLYLTEAHPAPESASSGANASTNGVNRLPTIPELLERGKTLDRLPPLHWSLNEAKSNIAYYCPTSGTSGAQVTTLTPSVTWSSGQAIY